MSDKTIRVSEDNWRRLNDLKKEGESFDDVVTRLTSDDKWRGFGALSETGIIEGMENAHAKMEREFRSDVDEMN